MDHPYSSMFHKFLSFDFGLSVILIYDVAPITHLRFSSQLLPRANHCAMDPDIIVVKWVFLVKLVK